MQLVKQLLGSTATCEYLPASPPTAQATQCLECLGRHAGPERAGSAEQLLVDDGDRRSAPGCQVHGGLPGAAAADDHDVEAFHPCLPM